MDSFDGASCSAANRWLLTRPCFCISCLLARSLLLSPMPHHGPCSPFHAFSSSPWFGLRVRLQQQFTLKGELTMAASPPSKWLPVASFSSYSWGGRPLGITTRPSICVSPSDSDSLKSSQSKGTSSQSGSAGVILTSNTLASIDFP